MGTKLSLTALTHLYHKGSKLKDYLEEVLHSDFVQHNKDITTIKAIYLCNALIELAKLEGETCSIKDKHYAKYTFDEDFIIDCLPYFCDRTNPSELSAEYGKEPVFRALMIWNTYNSKYETFEKNLTCITKFCNDFKPLDIFANVFSGADPAEIAALDTDEFLEYLSTCDVDEKSKDIISALHSVIDKESRLELIEDIFINQVPVITDPRIRAELRMDMVFLQMLAYDSDVSDALLVGYSNVPAGIDTRELINI